jgi:hypothetical protein
MARGPVHIARVSALCLILSLPLAGCESFDPGMLTDWIPDSKKKLPGERKEVFPQGVPGVVQGVPQELVKGNQPPPDASALAAPEPEPEPKVEEKPKPKPKPRTVTNRTRPPASVAPEQAQPQPQQQPQAAWPAPPPPAR